MDIGYWKMKRCSVAKGFFSITIHNEELETLLSLSGLTALSAAGSCIPMSSKFEIHYRSKASPGAKSSLKGFQIRQLSASNHEYDMRGLPVATEGFKDFKWEKLTASKS